MTALRFEKIEIDRLAGIPRGSGFNLEGLSKDINLIHGPNGSGKSLTGQSLLALVWPAATVLERPTIAGTWTLGESTWDIELDAGHPIWRCDGVVVDPPPLQSAESRSRHWLGLRELLSGDGPDAAATAVFAQRIARELLGGFDLNGAISNLGYSARPPQPRKLRTALDEANAKLRVARSKEQELHTKSLTIDSLRDQRNLARDADERRRRLDKALEHRSKRDEVFALEAQLSEFDEVLDHLIGNERTRFDEMRNRIADAERDLAKAEREAEESKQAQSNTHLTGDGVPNDLMQSVGQKVTAIQDAQLQVGYRTADLEEARAELRSFAARVASEVSDETLEAMGVTPFDEMAQYARDLVVHRELMARVQVRNRELSESNNRLATEADALGKNPVDQLRRGLDVLSRWLEAPPQLVGPAIGWLVPLAVAAGVIAALFIVLALLHHWLWLLGVIFAGLFVWLARPVTPVSGGANDRATYEQEFGQTQLSQPASWTVEAIQEVWSELGEAWAARKSFEAAKQRHNQEAANVAELRRQVEDSANRLAMCRENLEAALAFDIDDTRADWLHVLGENLAKWQTAKARVDAIEAKLGEQRRAMSASLSTFNGRLAPFVEDPAQDVTDAAGQLEDLRTRTQSYREARTKADQAERERTRAQSLISETTRQLNTLLAGLGLDVATEGRLDQWLEQREEYLHLKQRLADARSSQSTIAADVGEEHPALGFDRSRIETERDSAQRDADQLSTLDQEIGAINREVTNAKSGSRVEEAQQDVERAAEALSRELKRTEQQVAGHAVVEWLREEATEKTQPAVLRQASVLFQRITYGRYELSVDDAGDGPTFIAWDTEHEVRKMVNQLSAGERVQLLVAVRLGFLEQEETGVRLPLILDETLGTTDDERASAIIDTVVEICRSGRQVFYFTAQPDEVGKWVSRLQGVTDLAFKRMDLGRIRGLAEADGSPLVIERPAEAQLPDPTGVSHYDYGNSLNVPGLDPNRRLGMLHLWHLIDDPMVLYALLRQRIRCWGPFESLVQKGGLKIDGLDDDVLKLVGARAKVIRTVFAACRVGRGKPVDREALTASKVVTGAFIDRLADLAASLGGDANSLIDAIENGQVQRWRSNNTEPLREYLEEQGYLDPEVRLTRDEVYHRALEAAAKERPDGDLGEGWLDRAIESVAFESGGDEVGGAE